MVCDSQSLLACWARLACLASITSVLGTALASNVPIATHNEHGHEEVFDYYVSEEA